eukprot:scpid66058/ scgid21309/ 
MALPLGMLGASGCKNGGMQSVFSFLEELRGCFQVVNCPKDARSEMEQAKTCVLNLNVIVHKVMDMAFKMTFQLHQAGPGGKGDRRERERLQKAIACAIREGRKVEVSIYEKDLKTRWDSLKTEIEKLNCQDASSYISITHRKIEAFHEATSKADSSFWQRHPITSGIIGGAIAGGAFAAAISVPVIGWIGCLISLGGATAGAVVMSAVTPDPEQALTKVSQVEQTCTKMILDLQIQFDFLDCNYEGMYLLDALEEKWRDEDNFLKDAICRYPGLRRKVRKLRAGF